MNDSSLDLFAIAIEQNDVATMLSLIARGEANANSRLPLANSPPALVLAADLGHERAVDALLRAGARVNDTDDEGYSACHAAAEHQHLGVLHLLLAHRPVLDIPDATRRKPLDLILAAYSEVEATHRRRRHLVDAPVPAPVDDRVCAMLIRAGAPLDQEAALIEIAMSSAIVVRALVGRGVQLRGRKLLHRVVFEFDDSKLAVLHALINVAHVDVDERDARGDTCCHVAASRGAHAALRWLISAGADLEVENISGCTPLHWACKCASVDCILLLCAAGACVDVRSGDGNLASHWAAAADVPAQQTIEAVYWLVCAGADMDAPDLNGITTRHMLADKLLLLHEDAIDGSKIAKARLELVRARALQVCIGLQPLALDATQTCEILAHACGPLAPLVLFHHWWKIATTVKHFHRQKKQQSNNND
jgi:ankyrin repeat protein